VTRTLVLVRHGATEWNSLGKLASRTDLPLTDEGKAEARTSGRLVESVLGGPPQEVWSSPAARAIESTELAFPTTRLEVNPDLLEADFGDYEGLTRQSIETVVPGWNFWRDGCPGGENLETFANRVRRVRQALLEASSPSVLFGHGVMLRTLMCLIVDLRLEDGEAFVLNTGAVVVLKKHHDGRARVHGVNVGLDQLR
jgi:probable phosphoglycerate mutase